MYKVDLALNILQWLICHKPNQIKPNTQVNLPQIFVWICVCVCVCAYAYIYVYVYSVI